MTENETAALGCTREAARDSEKPRREFTEKPQPKSTPLEKLDAQIDGLRAARRLLADAQHVALWGYWAGREPSRHAVHAIASARDRIGRDMKKLKIERAALSETAWLP